MSATATAPVRPDEPSELDGIFAALSSPARRTMLVRLASGPASVSELAALVTMSQPAVSKNLKVLEEAGLVARGRDAQRRPRVLRPEALALADDWVATLRRSWEDRLDRLGAYLTETVDEPPARPIPPGPPNSPRTDRPSTTKE